MFKASIPLFLLSQSINGFVHPTPAQIKPPATVNAANLHGRPVYNSLRDMASYPDEMKMMENYAEFDRNGAFSGNRGYNNAAGGAYYNGGGNNNNYMGGKNYYGSDGSYYANRQGRGGGGGGGGGYNDGQRFMGDRMRRDREISFRGSRGYNGSYSTNGRGYDGIERFGRQRIPSYNGYNGTAGGGGGRMNSYSGSNSNNAYSNRPQYDFRRGGDRSGYAYADSSTMDYNGNYGRGMGMGGARAGEYNNDPRYRPREDRPVRGFAYSSRVRENDYGPYYYGEEGMTREDMMMMYDRDRRMDGGMGYGGYDEYGQEYGYYNQGGDRRRGYGMVLPSNQL